MRPTTVATLVFANIVGLIALVLGIYVFADHSSGKLWFYWIAPLLTIGLGGMLISLSAGYYMKVGRLETKGRPRSD